MQKEAIEGYRLSPQQEQLWALQQGVSGYALKCHAVTLIEGRLDRPRLDAALQALVRRYEILRTGFEQLDGMTVPLQVVQEVGRVPIEESDWSGLEPASQQEKLEALQESVQKDYLEFEKAPLLRVWLVTLGPSRHFFLLSLPSMCSDARALQNLVSELASLYETAGQYTDHDEVPIQYADLAEWQHELLESDDSVAGKKFWRSQKITSQESLALGLEKKPLPGTIFDPVSIALKMDDERLKSLQMLARESSVSLRTILLGAWQVLLLRHLQQSPMIVGVYGENRGYAELHSVVGLLAKTVPVVSTLEGSLSFRELISRLDATLQMVKESQEVFSWHYLGLEGEASQQLPFQFDYIDPQLTFSGDGVSFQIVSLYICTSPFKLKLSCSESAAGLDIELFYDSRSYVRPDVLLLSEQFNTLLGSLGANPERTLSELGIMPEEQRSVILKEWSGEDKPYPREKALAELYEEQVERTPNAPAVTFATESLTYAELNRRANQLGNYLRKKGVTSEHRIGLLMERSLEMVVGILGILKAGGAYVPLDPQHPQDRLKYMVEDAGIKLLLVQNELKEVLQDQNQGRKIERIVLDDEAQQALITQESASNIKTGNYPSQLAYVIYTSGSTGKPKGVMIGQEAILHRLWWTIKQFPMGTGDAVLQKTAFTFDASVWEILVPLMTGARLVMAKPGGQADSRYLIETIEREKITVLQLVPSMLRILQQEPGVERCRSTLKRVFSGGEALSREVVEQFRRKLDGVKLQNLYGPTETSIDAASWSCDGELNPAQAYMPLGRPLTNVRIYLLDEQQELVPVGVTGEIHIGGAGLGRGYTRTPELTAERFVPNPFSDRGGERLYRTGDLGRYRADGVIEFLGRKDEQVKVRGYRIELGEIEAELASHPAVREAAVAALEDESGGKRLVGYVVLRSSRKETKSSERDFREYLSGRLPDYMIPAVVLEMKELPRTPNGKLDRRSLPQPDFGSSKEYVAPRTMTEEILAQLWADVLKVNRVSVAEDFFDAGGHSLLATQLMARVRETFGIEIALARLFEQPTIEDLGCEIEQELRGTEGALWRGPIQRRTEAEKRGLSYAQQRLWFLDQLEPGVLAYNLSAGIELEGELNVAVLERSVNEVIRRHESLRTRFAIDEDGEPEQIVLPEDQIRIDLPVHQVARGSIEDKRKEMRRLAEAEAATPFNLRTGPLLRMKLLKLAERHHVALVTLHHIVSDGWSQALIIEELGALYAAQLEGHKPEMKELPIQYGDYAAWQREWLKGEVLEKQLKYWRKQLSGMSGVLELPTQYPRSAVQSYRGAHYRRSLDADLSQKLRELSSRENVTLYMLLLAALDVLLWRYSGQTDIAVGSPIANRTRKETEKLIGFFVNTLVLRVELDAQESFSRLLKRVRNTALGAYAHQDVPFEKLVEELKPERDMSRSPLFQVMFALQNMPFQELELPGLKVKSVEMETSIAKFDLTLFVSETAGVLDAVLEYNTSLFSRDAAERMWAHWEELLRSIVADPEKQIAALPLLRAEERHQILHEWNQTQQEFPGVANVVQLFEQQVERTPDAPAVRFKAESLTYAELNCRANVLAQKLIASRVSAEAVVGLLVERNLNFLTSMLAVWKAGGAYLPLDSKYPVDRLQQIIRQSGLDWIIAEDQHAKLLSEVLAAGAANCKPVVVTITNDYEDEIHAGNPLPRNTEKNLAYVIYTSGSTGIPKGAMVEQVGMVNHLYAKIGDLELKPTDRIAQTAPQSFDISVWQFIAGLLAGSEIEIVPEETAHDPFALWQLVQDRGVTILEVVPSLLGSLLHEDEQLAQTTSLRWLLVTGEAVTPQTCRQWLLRYPQVPMLNAYGPTECSDDVTHHVIRQIGQEIDRIPIGRTLANLKMYVLDQRQEPVPVGVSGELYVGGIGVGRGYLNDPSRTAESFVPNPFGTEPGARLYRTGDLGRYCENGVIDYLGRVDQQVKIRGFRIELAEIETALASHDSVQEAAVLARQDEPGDRRLVAYIVFKQSHSGNVGTHELKNYLQQKLPDYMVPSTIVVLAAVPRTANGKLDRKALPKPAGLMLEGKQFFAAQTEQEVLLAQMWADVLKLERVGARDDFFDLGGHSLLATQLMAKVRKVFRVENMPLRKLFENPTVQGLARAIAEERQEDALPIPRRKDHARAPLSYMQRRLWFLEQLGPGNSTYNLSSAVKLDGFLDVHLLELSLNAVAERHDALRTHFEVGESSEPEQVIIPGQEFKIELPLSFVAGGSSAEKWQTVQQLAEAEATQPFDLSNGPLLRAKLLQMSEHEHVALFTLHHIISDGWSQAVLIEEIGKVYAAYAQSTQPKLEELPIQYGDYAAWQREWLQGVVLDRQLQYWRKQLEGMSGVLELPTDRPRPAIQSYRGAHYRIELPGDLSSRLQKLAREEKATFYMALLAAWNVLLWRYSGQKDITLGTPIANRIRQETEKLIGFFVNTLVMRTEIDPEESFHELLARVRETALGAYANQDVPFEKLVEELKPERDLSRSPIFQIMFALQNMPTISLDIPGLTVRASDVESHTSKFDLTLFITEDKADKLLGWMEYSTDLFDEATIARMGGHWITLLESMVARPASPIADLPLLSAQERHEIVFDWNHTDRQYSQEKTIVGIIEDQVEKTPQVIAVVFEGQCITYAELNSRSNQLAHFLRKKGLTQEHLVGVCMERSIEMVVALLGILKAGAAYVPLDASYPPDRLTYMLEDADVRLLLTQQHLAPILAELNSEIACLDRDWNLIAGEPAHNPVHSLSGENLAYVIYTSGSTGRPKGAMNRHHGIRNRLQWMQQTYGIDVSDRVLQKTPFSFDVSVWEFFWPLMTGARLVVAGPGGHQDPAYLAKLIQQEGITTIHFVPSMLQAFVEEPGVGDCRSLRRVICSGEALNRSLQERFHERISGTELHNLYGPTEAAVDVTWWKCEPETQGFTVPLGWPIANIQIHILDHRLEPVPVGVAGEIHIGGIGLGRGYWRKPSLTAEKFIPNPFSQTNGERLYKTGDLGRYRPGGVIEFLGRLDHQVKIRGFRIELGEIEAALSAHQAVREAVVLTQDDGSGNKKLVAYVVLQHTGEKPAIDVLQQHLRERLPDYMVPGIIVELQSMPLSPNGKLDRNALPKAGVERKIEYAPPQTPDEKLLVEIWSDVLKVERVGIDENFFTLGGDSILSIQVRARAQMAGLNFSLQDLFRYQTIRELARHKNTDVQEQMPGTGPFSLIAEEDRRKLPDSVEDAYPLSALQLGMLFHQEFAKDHPVYHNVNSYHLRMVWDHEKFQAAAQAVVDRHPVLRTSFDLEGYSEPLQLVHRHVQFPIEENDWRGLSAKEQEQAVAEFIEMEKFRRFDLSKAPQLRFYVHRRSADTIQFSLTENHAILDGWSLHATLTEIFNKYFLLLKGHSISEPPLPTTYREFIALERKDIQSQQNERFWKQALEDAVPCKLPPGGVETMWSRIELSHVEISDGLSAGLKNLAKSAGVALKTILLAAHLRVLSVIAGTRDVITGVVFHGRPATVDGDQIRGLFLNTVPFRQRVVPGNWLEFIRSIVGTEERLLPHSRYPFSLIQRGAGDQELFETIFNFVNFHVADELLRSGETEILNFKKYEATNYKLMAGFSINQITSQVTLTLEYDVSQVSVPQAQTWARYYETALRSMTDDPMTRHEIVSLLTEEERRQILYEWNQTKADYASAACVHEFFEAQAAKRPDAPAVVFEQQRLSYAELNRQANQLAHHLRELGVKPETRVAICADRGLEMVVAVLGVLKAGGTYVPLDPSYPEERLHYILNDSAAVALLTQKHLQELFREWLLKIPIVDLSGEREKWRQADDRNLFPSEIGLNTSYTAYIIYTSGSTGQPKGVMVEHHNITRLFTATEAWFHFDHEDVWTLFHSYAFDFSVWEIWGALLYGGCLIVVPRDTARSAKEFYSLLCREKVTVLSQTPSAFRQLMAAQAETEETHHLRYIVFGGEALEVGRLRSWYERSQNQRPRLINMYGITETTVHVTYRPLDAADVESGGSPVGCRIPDLKIYILDSYGEPVPVGVVGELYVGGAGLARGYLHRPEMTAERFIPDRFSSEPGTRLYRTGDLGWWRSEGNIEFVGRNDSQVKIRGFRIELGEIEARLQQCSGVAEAVVVAREDTPGEKRLVAYYTCAESRDGHDGSEFSPGAEQLRAHLTVSLPEYMVPAAYVRMENLPLTVNGKLDRKSLPMPEGDAYAMRTYEAPVGETEQRLAEIWAEVLDVERVGRHDNFFNLGGHSLLGVQLIARVRSAFRVEVPLDKLFEYVTVEEFSRSIEEMLRDDNENAAPVRPILRRTPEEKKQLSFAQQRLWFMDLFEPGNAFYNIPAALMLEGELSIEALQQSLNALVERHEVLRTRFDLSATGEPEQVVLEPLHVELPVVEVAGETGQEKIAVATRLAIEESTRPFNLKTGPLMRVRLLRIAPDRHVALFTLHHIISDQWSQGILIEEVSAFYAAFVQSKQPSLQPLPVQYGDYAAWQRELLQGEVLQKQLQYWRAHLSGTSGVLSLPTDRPRPPVQTFNGANYRFLLGPDSSRHAQELARQENATLYMVLLAAFDTLLWRYSSQKDIIVGTPIANRKREETEGLIGLFMNTLVLRTEIDDRRSFRDLLRKVREITLGAYTHQDIPFEKLVEELNPQRDLSRSPLFQVMFTLQNARRGQLTMPGLKVEGVEVENRTAKFELTMFLNELPSGELESVIEYNTDLFDQSTIARMAGYWQTLVRSIADAADQPLAALPFLTESERRHIIVDWNLTQRAYARETTLVQLFEQQVRNSPNDLAVVFEEKTLSFSALNRQANQLARYLQSKGVGPESLVGICVERSIQMMVGLLGIWKAGAAYVPLDPAYPGQRLQQMMDDCRARLLLTQESVAAALPETAAGLIYLDRDWPQIGAHPEDDLAVPIRAENLAYVIYTSGSTGKPKGVMVRHNGVANFAAGMDDCLAHDIQGTWLAVTSLSFDISVLELLWTLSRGFRVILQTGGIAGEVESVLKQIRKHEVTHFQCTPSMAGLLLLDPEAPATLAGLRKMLVGGEHLPLHLASQLQQIVRGQVINMYGPTETTIWSSSWALHENMANVAIGRPLANTQLYVLDENMEPVPIGAAGELYIGGHGIARGYLSRPELTAEKFVPDHLGQAPGERLYRTGDLARHRADGTIEYLGRIDQQVKLRGYRIELGEIESILATHELVREAAAAVLDDAGSNKRLVGYVVLNLEARTSASTIFIADDLREYLRGKLPDYMVPAMIVELDQMPLTPNGKLDRRSLPKPESASLRKAEYVAPVGDLEVMLAGLWSEFLAIKGVSRNDSFFELGGHSLLAIQLMSRVREVFRVDVQMRSIFEHPTPAAYAGMLRSFELQPAEMEQIAQLMNTIDQMSETEVMAALEQGELGATQQ